MVARRPRGPRRRQRVGGGGRLGHQGVEVRLDRRITGDHLLLKGVEEFEVLLEDKDVLGAIVLRAAAISRSEA